ncbi:MAG: DUF1501 domain-containing protein [Candidatus Omnitrophica bacterium]|nr:DUF1501 domain-containing protein [Candidatus Omnitrophota bacterium]
MDAREWLRVKTRREFLKKCGAGIGSVALSGLLDDRGFAATSGILDKPHFAPKAKRVIYLAMIGAPSQLDLFDYKPKLQELDGQPVPESLLEGRRFVFLKGVPNLLGSPYQFKQYGQAGVHISEQLPHLPEIIDDIAVIKSMNTNEINHVPAQLLINTGSPRQGRPSMGSWVSYGLGSESEDLPAYVVLASGKAGRCGSACFASGFLPTQYQGVQFRSQGDPVLFLENPKGIDADLRRMSLDALKELNEQSYQEIGDPEINARIASFEMAYRMQSSVPELMDITTEPQSIQEMYGTEPGKTSFANNCLLARRLIEKGVRFVHLAHGGWDHHGGRGDQNLVTNLPQRCQEIDQASVALVKDLKQRGLLEDTLVVWGGEFGRTPMLQGVASKEELGRDHLISAYTIWMTGGGIKRGIQYGETDEIGMNTVKDPVHVHDLQATILRSLGIDHKRLTYRFQGRDYRLTDVHGNVVEDILA